MNLRLILAFCSATGFLCAQTGTKKLAESDCTTQRLGTSIPAELVAEPAGAVTSERSCLETRSRAVARILQHRWLDGPGGN